MSEKQNKVTINGKEYEYKRAELDLAIIVTKEFATASFTKVENLNADPDTAEREEANKSWRSFIEKILILPEGWIEELGLGRMTFDELIGVPNGFFDLLLIETQPSEKLSESTKSFILADGPK